MKKACFRVMLLFLTACFCVGCGNRNLAPAPAVQTMPQPIADKPLSIAVAEHRKQEFVFSFTIDDFISAFHYAYQKQYFTTKDTWDIIASETSVHVDYPGKCYRFSENKSVWTLPTICVYTPSDEDLVQGITVNFDDHSYQEDMYKIYEELCFVTLKTFFADLPETQLKTLYQTLNTLAYDNVFPNEKGYAGNPTPCALYYRDNVGVYPYYAIGESVRMCVIPVNETVLRDFAKRGTKLYEVKKEDDR